MNRDLELQVFDEFVDEHYFPPAKNWPRQESLYRSCCRWALSEIRREFVARRDAPILDILGDMYAVMEDAMACADETEPYNGLYPTPSMVFGVGREMTEIVAGLYL